MPKDNTNKKTELDEFTEQITKRIADNLNTLFDKVGVTKKTIANDIGVSDAAISNYCSGLRLIPIPPLIKICSSDLIRGKGIYLSVDDFVKKNELFKREIDNTPEASSNESATDLDGYIGNYFCYFYDQTRSADEQQNTAYRGMRYGVISIFREDSPTDGVPKLVAGAIFYQQDKKDIAIKNKNEVDELKRTAKTSDKIYKFYSSNKEGYIGELSSNAKSIFITLCNPTFKDQALIILPASGKREDAAYRGGLGSLNSVSHGVHVPAAQKILISGEVLNCPNEDISEYLTLSSDALSAKREAEEIAKLCEKLYNPEKESLSINESDKIAIIANRMNHLVSTYIDNNVDSVVSVTSKEDKNAYKFIKKKADWSDSRWN